jgi:hypothetical protein
MNISFTAKYVAAKDIQAEGPFLRLRLKKPINRSFLKETVPLNFS